jgi:hypothetical protein
MSYIMTKDLIAKEVWRMCAAHLHKEWLDWRTLELAAKVLRRIETDQVQCVNLELMQAPVLRIIAEVTSPPPTFNYDGGQVFQ